MMLQKLSNNNRITVLHSYGMGGFDCKELVEKKKVPLINFLACIARILLHSSTIPGVLIACRCLERVRGGGLNSRRLGYSGDGRDMLPTGNWWTKYKLLIVLTGSSDVLLFASVSSGLAFAAGLTSNR